MAQHTHSQKSGRHIKKLVEMNDKQYFALSSAVLNIGCSMVDCFKVNEYQKPIYRNLLHYFTGNDCDYDLSKGIYLYGSYGIGKTVAMSIFSKFLADYFPFTNGYGITSMEKLAESYKIDGDLVKFGRNYNNEGENPKKYCFNELGKDLNEKHFGTNIQYVINSMLMTRYELYQEKGILTHATSNFHPSELTCFDNAIIDRFSEMFNFIEMKGESLR